MLIQHKSRHPLGTAARASIGVFLLMAVLAAGSQTAYGQSDYVPQEVRDLKMGTSEAAVKDVIKGVGSFSTEKLEKEPRMRLIWTNESNPYYKNIMFQFTEKDHLYLIRFTLNDAARRDYHTLKKAVFKDYDFSWENPTKLRLKDDDILVYAPEKGLELYFFEFTNTKTHEKAFELFNRSVSATDRPERPAPQQKADQPPAGQPLTSQPAPSPQPVTAKEAPKTDTPAPAEKPKPDGAPAAVKEGEKVVPVPLTAPPAPVPVTPAPAPIPDAPGSPDSSMKSQPTEKTGQPSGPEKKATP